MAASNMTAKNESEKMDVKRKNSKIIKLKKDSVSESDEESEDDFFDREKIKKKFMSAWMNVKYGFNVQISKPSFNDQNPVWLLGRCYHIKNTDTEDDGRVVKDEHKVLSLDQFFEDFSSLVWLTYRKKFETLAKSNLTSDGGWGCMLRSGQMLLANAILIHMLREGWRTSQRATSYEKNYIYRMDKADILQDQFCSVFTNEPAGSRPEFPSRTDTDVAFDLTIDMIKKELKDLNPNKLLGPNEIHPVMLKKLAFYIAGPLHTIMAKSFVESKLPDDWKTAHMCPRSTRKEKEPCRELQAR
ncbi:cysteine protease atg-4.2-like [Clytia hemisphaerica]|uniref:cysteine protease atg-4.2-like n=1 Tax=Clytia hemisphaerica TaxID=252671 RepID=UPI0034D3EFB0